MVIIEGDGYNDPSSNLDETVFISHRDNTNVKDKNPTILLPPMGKIVLQAVSLTIYSVGEGKLCIQINLKLHPTHVEDLLNIYLSIYLSIYIYIYIYRYLINLLGFPYYQFFFTNCRITIHYFLPYIYIYILSSIDKLFCCIKTHQCG